MLSNFSASRSMPAWSYTMYDPVCVSTVFDAQIMAFAPQFSFV